MFLGFARNDTFTMCTAMKWNFLPQICSQGDSEWALYRRRRPHLTVHHVRNVKLCPEMFYLKNIYKENFQMCVSNISKVHQFINFKFTL